jgi:hypothetical protein
MAVTRSGGGGPEGFASGEKGGMCRSRLECCESLLVVVPSWCCRVGECGCLYAFVRGSSETKRFQQQTAVRSFPCFKNLLEAPDEPSPSTSGR